MHINIPDPCATAAQLTDAPKKKAGKGFRPFLPLSVWLPEDYFSNFFIHADSWCGRRPS